MKPTRLLLTKLAAPLAVCALAAFTPLAALAANGTWTNPAGGSWTDPASWSGGIIPGATDDTADFSTLTLGFAPEVTLDGATTVGNLMFGDVGNAYGWTLSTGGGGPLTLAVNSGSPTITVNNQTNTISLVLAGTQGLTKAGNGTLLLTGANTYTNDTIVSSGVLKAGNASNGGLPASGNVAISSGATFVFSAAAGGVTYNGQLSGTGNFVVPSGSRVNSGIETNSGSLAWSIDGILAASASNAHLTIGSLSGASTGSIGEGGSNVGRILTIGALNVDSTYNGTIISDIKVVKIGTGNLVLNGANAYTGFTTVSNGTLTIGGAGQLNGAGYAGLVTNNGVLNYSSSAAQTLSGAITGTGVIINNGPGMLTLAGVNTYSGATTLNGGTTFGATAGACVNSSVTVATTAATFGVAIANNTNNWNCPNLTFAAAGTLDFNFGTITPSGSVAPLVVSNAVTFTATPVVIVEGTAFGTLPVGSYPLMTWGSVSGTVPTAVTLPPHRGTANLSVTGNTLYLNITALGTQPLSWAASSGTWDIGLSSNWKDSANNITAYGNPDVVVFEDTVSGAGPITVTLGTNVAPAGVTFNNSSKAYTLAGTGAITGTTGLTKTGANTLVLVNTNSYTGGTAVQAGTLQLGDGVANNGVVAGSVVLSNGAALAFATPNDQTYASVISGSGGTLTKSGAGTLTLTVANTYTGGTMINTGTVQFLNPGKNAFSVITVNPNGSLLLNPSSATWNTGLSIPIILNGGTLAMTANLGNARYVYGLGATNVPTTSSFITVHAATAGAPNASTLFLDNGLTGSGTVTISSDTAGIGVVLRNNNTSFSGTLIVNGNATTINTAGSGLAVGANTTQPILTNADLQINGTMEMGGNGQGWGNGTVSGLKLPIGALNGSGVVVANMPTAGSTRGLNIGGNNHNGIFSGQIDNGNNDTLSLTKSGSGTQVLSGGNSYTGITTVSGGTLQVNGFGYLQSPVTVASGGTLGGDGTLGGAVTVQGGGTLTVGTNSTLDMLTIYNALTLANSSTNVMRISKNGGTLASDQVMGLTSVTYGGTLTVLNITSDATALALGDTFTLYPFAGTYNPGGFANVILPALPGGLSWNLNNLTVDGSITISDQVSTPLFSPAGGGYAGAQSVTISSATPGATIRYTTDGSTPTSSSPVYSSPITVPVPTISMTIKAYATLSGVTDSAAGSATYATVMTPTWLNPYGGNWSDTSSWSNTVVANGIGVTADFSTLDLSLSGSPIVTLNTPATVGGLVFGDQENTYSWTLGDGGAGPLTLDAGASQPVINVVNTETIISAGLAGTKGFIKAGAGTLTLSGANTYTGNTIVNAGVGGLKFTTQPSFTTFTGNGTIEFNFGTALNEVGTFGSGFTGQINITGVGTVLTPGSFMSANLGDVLLDSGAGCNLSPGQAVQVDELTGSGSVNSGGVVNPVFATLTLGANNGHGTNAEFSGPFTAGNNSWISIVKNGTGAQTLSGNLANGLGALTVKGGTLTLSGTNTYTGATTVSNGTLLVNGSLDPGSAVTVSTNGTLGGSGTIGGAATIQTGGTLSPGDSIGTLNFSNSLALAGNVLIEVNKALSPSSDMINVAGAISYGGTLTATNIGGTPLVAGDSFPVFPAGGTGSLTLAGSPGAGLSWSFSPASGVLSVVTGVTTNPNPTNIVTSVSGGQLTMSWPADHTGWTLEAQTNSLNTGLSGTWYPVGGSTTTNSMTFPIDPAKPTVFYRLTYP